MGPRYFSGLLALVLISLSGQPDWALAGPSRALAPAAERIFNSFNASSQRRYVMETFLGSREGRALARRAEINSLEDLAERLVAERASRFGRDLQAQLRKIDDAFDDFRRLKAENGGPVTGGRGLSKNERFLLRFLVRRYLKIQNADDVVKQLLPRQHQFFQGTSQIHSTRKSFAQLDPVDPVPTSSRQIVRPGQPVPPVSAAAEAAARTDVDGWFKRLRGCMKARANGTHHEQIGKETDRAYLWQGLFVNTSLAGTAYVTSVGTENVDWSNLSTDLIVTIASTVVGSKIMAGRMNLKTRWMRVLMFGAGRTVVDGTIYMIDPLDRLTGDQSAGHTWDETSSRSTYNVGYNVLNSPKSMATYLLFNGIMDCFPNNRAVQFGVVGLRALENVGSSFLFFHARQWYLER